MNVERIAQLISQGEGLTTEFKKAGEGLPQSLFETICAFLNKAGGTILLGVTDDKNVTGVNPEKAEQYCKDIANTSNNPHKFSPSFLLDAQIVHFQEKILISVFVPISSQVHRLNGKVYDRSVDGDYEVKTDSRLKEIYNRKSTYYTENTIYPYLYESDFVPGIVDKARNSIRRARIDHPWNDLSNKAFYRVAGLYRKDISTQQEGFTMSALLLFGKEEIINSALPHYKTEALLRRKDIDRYDDRETIRCNLINAYDKLLAFINKHLPDKFYLEGDMRISLRERIFREIVANMLIHREFTNGVQSSLIIYNDRVETKNANKPHYYGNLLPGQFEPFPKNPNLANFFVQLARAETLGTGIRNVYKYSKAYSGSDSLCFNEDDLFKTIVPLSGWEEPNNDHEIGGQTSGTVINERQKQLLEYVKERKILSMAECKKILSGTSERTISRDLHDLVKAGIFVKIGDRKATFYKINGG